MYDGPNTYKPETNKQENSLNLAQIQTNNNQQPTTSNELIE